MSRWAAGGLIALTLGSAAPATAADFRLLVTSSANLSEATLGGQSASLHNFIQTVDMGYNRDVTPRLTFRLRVLGSDNESTASQASSTLSATSRFIEPRADVIWTGPKFSFDGGVRYRQTFVSGSEAQPLTLTENQEFLRAFWTPDLLPAFNVQVDRVAAVDDRTPHGVDRSVTRGIFGANYTLAQKLSLMYTFTGQTNDDKVANRTQEQRSQVATANYADSFFSDRLSVNGTYLYNRLKTTETFGAVAAGSPGGPVLLPVVISRAFGLIEFDPAVANQSKIPPLQCSPAVPPCTSLSSATSTVLNITANLVVNAPGPPNNNESIIFGLTPGASVSTVRLTVSPRAGDPRDISLQAVGVTFQVFEGANPNVDLTTWTQVAIASATPPTSLNPYFEISFAATGGTFIKIHVAGDLQQPAFPPLVATAIEAFIAGTAPGAPGFTKRLTTGNTLQSVTAGITAQPINALSVTANGTYSTNTQDFSGRTDNNGNYYFTATGTPHRLLTATGTYQASFTTSSDPQTPRTDQRYGSIVLSSTPLPTLTASLSGTLSESEVGGVKQDQAASISFNTAARPYRNLNVDLTTTTSQSKNFVDGTRSESFNGALNANAILTDRLTGLLGLSFSNSRTTGGTAPSSFTAESGHLSLTYTLTRFLNLNSRWDFSQSGGIYSVAQQYRLDVIPTLKTSVLVTLQRIDQWGEGPSAGPTPGGISTAPGSSSTSRSVTNANVQARWNISRYLDLSATTSATWNSTGDTVYSIFTTLSFRL
ncbi:MAG TPA: hypothetical protein VIG69_01085 [Candidatus Methylomirabilis sp.]